LSVLRQRRAITSVATSAAIALATSPVYVIEACDRLATLPVHPPTDRQRNISGWSVNHAVDHGPSLSSPPDIDATIYPPIHREWESSGALSRGVQRHAIRRQAGARRTFWRSGRCVVVVGRRLRQLDDCCRQTDTPGLFVDNSTKVSA